CRAIAPSRRRGECSRRTKHWGEAVFRVLQVAGRDRPWPKLAAGERGHRRCLSPELLAVAVPGAGRPGLCDRTVAEQAATLETAFPLARRGGAERPSTDRAGRSADRGSENRLSQ